MFAFSVLRTSIFLWRKDKQLGTQRRGERHGARHLIREIYESGHCSSDIQRFLSSSYGSLQLRIAECHIYQFSSDQCSDFGAPVGIKRCLISLCIKSYKETTQHCSGGTSKRTCERADYWRIEPQTLADPRRNGGGPG
jgi:hypothetical protein